MKKQLTFTYEWWVNEDQEEIPEDHKSILSFVGYNNIRSLFDNGFDGTEMQFECDGIYYNGYLDFTYKTLE